MLEVTFSESEKGVIQQAKAMHGDSKEIVSIGFFLEIGDITGKIDGKERQDVFQQTLGRHHSDNKHKERLFSEQRKDLESLMAAATAGDTIRIWKSNAPYSISGFHYICNLLKDIDCPIRTVSLHEPILSDNQTITAYNNWGEVSPVEVYDYLSFEESISELEKRMRSNHWEELKKENAPLRAIVNGKLISVPENFYDFLILKNIPDDEFRVRELIARLLMKYKLNVMDRWYALRIDQMIEEAKLVVIENKENDYERVIKKTDRVNNT